METEPYVTGQAERAGERYRAADGWLRFLIDHPDKTVSVCDYVAQLGAAKKVQA